MNEPMKSKSVKNVGQMAAIFSICSGVVSIIALCLYNANPIQNEVSAMIKMVGSLTSMASLIGLNAFCQPKDERRVSTILFSVVGIILGIFGGLIMM